MLSLAAHLLAAGLWGRALPAEGQEIRFRPTVVREPHGGVIRGDVHRRQLALIFTGDEYAESASAILDILQRRGHKAGFFVTGRFARQPALRPIIRRMIDEGHYVGPHSDMHLLYCDWSDRSKSLVTQAAFAADLQNNVAALQSIGALAARQAVLFVPPYEWYNAEQVKWAEELGVKLVNFTPGSGSNRDYIREGERRYQSSQQILEEILAYERRDPLGLNGFLLLLHLGSGRKDPFHLQLSTLCQELSERGYSFVRVDELLIAD
ncbi:MAG: polysaccharide deacetylase [Planctomycetota bacterium]|nr:MAG: polysaccharide deacetylase [Planctomycetota bacterium]